MNPLAWLSVSIQSALSVEVKRFLLTWFQTSFVALQVHQNGYLVWPNLFITRM